ncbi:hypothetical protein FXO37_22490 [Capsicum annuum]|nr:hypothetical protein FXO37_22490 [Capsicum annuum]
MSDYVLAVSYYANYSFLACWRPGDLNWTYVDSDHYGPSIPQPIEVEAMKLVRLEKWWKCQRHGYLLELSGIFLIILRFTGNKFEVFEIDVNKAELKEVNTLGDYAVFVGFNVAICIDFSKFARVKSNHIYFTDDDNEKFGEGDGGGRNTGAYSLEDGKVESFYLGESLSHICPRHTIILMSRFSLLIWTILKSPKVFDDLLHCGCTKVFVEVQSITQSKSLMMKLQIKIVRRMRMMFQQVKGHQIKMIPAVEHGKSNEGRVYNRLHCSIIVVDDFKKLLHNSACHINNTSTD